MALTYTPVYDNPEQPGVFGFQYFPDQLIIDPKFLVSQPIDILAGVYQRGTVLGQTSTSTVTATPTAGNTGNGTVTGLSNGAAPEYGSFLLKATSATVFSVTGPEGEALPNATVGTAYVNSKLNFTINAGGTAYASGDSYTLSSVNTVGNFTLCVKTASDGSQVPVCILADLADATAGPVKAGGYFAGEFNENFIIMDASWTIQALRSALSARNIYTKTTQGSYSNLPES